MKLGIKLAHACFISGDSSFLKQSIITNESKSQNYYVSNVRIGRKERKIKVLCEQSLTPLIAVWMFLVCMYQLINLTK